MSSCRFTPLALSDLGGIHRYIARDNPANAVAWLEKIEAHCRHLASNSTIGRRRPELGIAVRSSNFGRYAVYYRPTDDGIHVLRVFHQSRDVRAIPPSDPSVG